MVIHYIYKIHFLCGFPAGRYYIGKHTHRGKDLSNDKYTGSGNFCHSYFRKYGKKEGVTYIKEIIEINPSAKINNDREIYHIGNLGETDELCMNLIQGGKCGINHNSPSKIVCQYDLDGNLLCKYNSQLEAAASVGMVCSSTISKCCIDKKGSAAGFIWRFEGDGFSCKNIQRKKISQYTKTGHFIKTYNSVKEASEILNIENSTISECCKGKRNSAGGFVGKYGNDDVKSDDFNVKYHEDRPVVQYDYNGNIVSQYSSLKEAYSKTGIHWQNIQAAMNNLGVAKGYLGRDVGYEFKEGELESLKRRRKRYIVKCGQDGNVIKIYTGINAAAKDNGIVYQQIQSVLKGKAKKAGGYYGKYGDVIE